MTYIKIYVNYTILHLIQSYQYSQLLPSVMLPQVTFLLGLTTLQHFWCLLFTFHLTVCYISIWKQLQVTSL